MDTNTHLRIYQKYADKLESLCRTHMSKAIVETILYDAWIDSVNEVLTDTIRRPIDLDEDIQQEIKDGYNE